jgi:hypothetical protein
MFIRGGELGMSRFKQITQEAFLDNQQSLLVEIYPFAFI